MCVKEGEGEGDICITLLSETVPTTVGTKRPQTTGSGRGNDADNGKYTLYIQFGDDGQYTVSQPALVLYVCNSRGTNHTTPLLCCSPGTARWYHVETNM